MTLADNRTEKDRIEADRLERLVGRLDTSLRRTRQWTLTALVGTPVISVAVAAVVGEAASNGSVDWSSVANSSTMHYALLAVVVIAFLAYQRD